MEATACLSYLVNSMAADDMAMHGASASAAMPLTTYHVVFRTQHQNDDLI